MRCSVANVCIELTRRSPAHPGEMDWSKMYPAFVAEGQDDAVEKEAITEQDGQVVKALTTSKKLTKDIEVADIGCGFGGLLVALAPTMPETLCLGQSSLLDTRDYALEACSCRYRS